MRILTASDLHLEFYQKQSNFGLPELPNFSEYDVVILAGDIWNGLKGVEWAENYFPKDKQVLFCPGNHSFYGNDYPSLQEEFQNYKGKHVFVLSPGSIIIDDTVFIGATLWSACDLPGYDTPDIMIEKSINDFRLIKNGSKQFDLNFIREVNKIEVEYITEALEANRDKKVVLFTHFVASMKGMDPKYDGNSLNPYFINNLDHLILEYQPALLISGHTHSRSDQMIGNTRFVINPRGYPGENPPFQWKIVEI